MNNLDNITLRVSFIELANTLGYDCTLENNDFVNEDTKRLHGWFQLGYNQGVISQQKGLG